MRLTLYRMGLFGAANVQGRGGPPTKICHTYSTMIKLGTVIPYLKKMQEIYKSPLEFQHEKLQEMANFGYIGK